MLFIFNSLEVDVSCRCSLNFVIYFYEVLEGFNDNFWYGDVIFYEFKVVVSYYLGDGSVLCQCLYYQKNLLV